MGPKYNYEPKPAPTKYSISCNRGLLKKIDNHKVDIRNVMKYAIERGLLHKDEWSRMDTGDARVWLVLNEIGYKEPVDNSVVLTQKTGLLK